MTQTESNQWAEKHMITSRTGRVYTPSMLISAATRRRSYLDLLGVTTADLQSVIRDERWTLTRIGFVPSAFVADLIDEAFSRVVAAKSA